ncbi:MAG TPA: FtsQ-type POTRA domain-containing protein [Deltaproteobacteria bacterium]|nr:FtsQ-type POTRA domain-containing protein [Deltaproteobacteria bacterium]HOI07191.1 FtsQ-type POTRA domain-containing protein [Deltaproteobacteria bacterium]
MIDYKETKKTASRKKTLSKINLAIRFSIWLCLGISGTLILLCAVAYVVNSELFHLKTIEVKGNAHVDRNEVLSLLDLERGDNIFSWDMEAAKGRLLANPWIKDISISRNLIPSRVTVRIEEHRPTATLFLKDKPYYVSEEGSVFAAATEDTYGFMIQAADYEPANGDEDLNGVLKSAMNAVAIVESRRLKVKDLVIEAGGVMNIRLAMGITLVILGEMTPRKVDLALRAIRELKPVSGTIMDLTCKDKIVLRNRGQYGSQG